MTIESQFDPVRFYASLDPYNWQVDNRPLEDIKNNLSVVAEYSDAIFDSAKSAAMAAGFVARGFATDNMYVGSLSYVPSSLNLVIDHGFLIQSLQASAAPPVDIRTYPHLGLQQSAKVFVGGSDLFAAGTVGNKNLFTIQARKIAANANISHFAPTNPHESGAFTVGVVQYMIKDNLEVLGTDPDAYPAPDGGWISILNIKIVYGETGLTQDNVHFDKFVLDGALQDSSQYEVYTTTTAGVSTTITSGITVDARDALVFIDGVFQNPTKYTVINSSSVSWSAPGLPADQVLDFVVIKGTTLNLTGGIATPYAYTVESFIATAGQQVFGPTAGIEVQFAFVFVNGLFQPIGVNYDSILQTITLDAPVPLGTIVDLAATAGGIVSGGVPPGGLPGQVLDTTTAGPLEWKYPARIATVSSITNLVGGTILYTVPDFDESTEMYDGMLVQVAGIKVTGDYISNKSTSVEVHLNTLVVPVQRVRGADVSLDDIYDGMVLRFNAVDAVFELQAPAFAERVFATDSNNISTDTCTLAPTQPIFSLQNGQQVTFTVGGTPVTDVSTSTTVLVTITVDGLPVVVPVQRNGGAPLRVADMVAGQTVTLQYDDGLGLFVLLNPAVQSIASLVEAVGNRRQTVLNGPRTSSNSYTGKAVSASASGSFTYTYAKPYLIRPCDISGVEQTSGAYFKVFTNDSIGFNDAPRVSFSAGFNDAGPIEYVEPLLASSTYSKATLAATHFSGTTGFTGASISTVTLSSAADTMTIQFSGAHGYQVGHWIHCSDFTNRLVNGSYIIIAVDTPLTNSVVVRKANEGGTPNGVGTSGSVSGILFAYVDRDIVTGVLTYGWTPYRPAYVEPHISDSGAGLTTVINRSGRHVFHTGSMKMTLGSGAGYTEVQRVFVGEVYLGTANLDVYSVVTYAYNGESKALLTGSNLTFNSRVYSIEHGLGTTLYNQKTRFSYGFAQNQISGAMTDESLLFGSLSMEVNNSDMYTNPASTFDPGMYPVYRDECYSNFHKASTGVWTYYKHDSGTIPSLDVSDAGTFIALDFTRRF